MTRRQRHLLIAVWATCAALLSTNAVATKCYDPDYATVAVIELRSAQVDGEAVEDLRAHTGGAREHLLLARGTSVRLTVGDYAETFSPEASE